MEKLNKKQKEILTCLNKVFPEPLNEDVLLTKLKDKPKDIDILADIKVLEKKKFVKVVYGLDSYFPTSLTITPEGIEKLQENIITWLYDSARSNPWTVIAVIISLCLGTYTVYYYSQNLMSQKINFDLQNKIIQDNNLKQILPPTVWLTQEFRNGSSGELEIIPTFYFKKNSDRLFTISNYEINVTLNGKREPLMGAGYKTIFKNEGISEGKIVFPSFYPVSINEYTFFHIKTKNDLILDYLLEIKDMDSQIIYRGNVTTEIDSSNSLPRNLTGREPIIFNWT